VWGLLKKSCCDLEHRGIVYVAGSAVLNYNKGMNEGRRCLIMPVMAVGKGNSLGTPTRIFESFPQTDREKIKAKKAPRLAGDPPGTTLP